MMKQWQFCKSGLPREVVHMVEVPIPTVCAENEVLIKISHVALNSAMVYKLMAHYSVIDPVSAYKESPCVPEVDFSGVVCDLKGAKAQHLKTGERVFGARTPAFMDLKYGVLREYALIKYTQVAPVPHSISLREASCFPASGVTMYYVMVEKMKVKEGDRVFITGGSGGVGVHAIQLARKLVGPTGLVVASCGTSKIDQVRSQGAHEVIDYTTHNLPQYLSEKYSSHPFDLIVDCVGNDQSLYSKSPAYLAPNGNFFVIGLELGDTFWQGTKRILQLISGFVLPVVLGGVPRKFGFESVKVNQQRLEGVAELVKEGTLRAVVDSVYKFEDLLEAYDRLLSRKLVGKIVVEVAGLD